MLATAAVQDHLPALVHHGQLDGVAVADMTVGLQERGAGHQPRFHRLVASRLRAIAVGQRVLKIGVEQLMAMLAQKHQKLPRLAGAGGYFLLFRGQHNGRVPQNRFLKVEGARCSFTYQITDMPLLSTLYEPLSKQLISVLVSSYAVGQSEALTTPPACVRPQGFRGANPRRCPMGWEQYKDYKLI